MNFPRYDSPLRPQNDYKGTDVNVKKMKNDILKLAKECGLLSERSDTPLLEEKLIEFYNAAFIAGAASEENDSCSKVFLFHRNTTSNVLGWFKSFATKKEASDFIRDTMNDRGGDHDPLLYRVVVGQEESVEVKNVVNDVKIT